MKTFRLSRTDFKHLSEVDQINSIKEGEYKTEKNKSDAKYHIDEVKKKMHFLLDKLQNEPEYNKHFEMGLSRIRKRTQKGGIPGKYRDHLWIWMVDNNEYKKLKNKRIQSPQLSLPQIQISINQFGFTSAELWFEHKALYQWRDKITEFFKKPQSIFKNLEFYLYNSKIDKREFEEFGDKKSIDEFINMFNSRNDLKGGIGYVYSKTEVIGKNTLYHKINSDLNKLIKLLYEPIVGYSKLNNIIIKPFKFRNRKESKDTTMNKIFRKGSEGGEVNQTHRTMQREYVKYLKEKYGKNNVKPEEDFIDIRVNNGSEIRIYELKTDKSAYKCIRQALGQLLFYAWRVKNKEPKKKIRLFVMGLNEMDGIIKEFYEYVKVSIRMELKYIRYPFKI